MAESRLDQVVTSWTILGEMQQTLPPEDRNRLWEDFLRRYESVIRRYLTAIVRDGEKVDELYSRFLQRCVTSVVPRADRTKGRFRDLVKTVLLNLVRSDWADRGNKHRPLPDGVEAVQRDPEATFDEDWREHLGQRAVEAFNALEDKASRRAAAVLRFKIEHPKLRSAAIAAHFSQALGKTVSPEWVRKQLLVARKKVAEMLVREVERTLDGPAVDDLEEELAALGLLEQCREALAERRG